MAPKKSAREKEFTALRPTHAFFPPGLNREATVKLERAAASDWNEHGATVCHPAAFSRLESGDARIFSCFVVAGLVPPMSLFFHAVLAAYTLHVAHLHPNAVLLLAMFQHCCEAFVGIHPNVALFRHFFRPRVEAGRVSGLVAFTRRTNTSRFVPMELRNKWEEFRHQWCFVRFPAADDSLLPPTEAPSNFEGWDNLGDRDEEFAPTYTRIEALCERGLTGRHVVLDFLRCVIAPLQLRSHPMWAYEGESDRTRLRGAYSQQEEIELTKMFLQILFGGESSLTFPAGILPLHRDPQ